MFISSNVFAGLDKTYQLIGLKLCFSSLQNLFSQWAHQNLIVVIASDMPCERLAVANVEQLSRSLTEVRQELTSFERFVIGCSEEFRSKSMLTVHKTVGQISKPLIYSEVYGCHQPLDKRVAVGFEKLRKIMSSHFAL